jgi:hypothetical protein
MLAVAFNERDKQGKQSPPHHFSLQQVRETFAAGFPTAICSALAKSQ